VEKTQKVPPPLHDHRESSAVLQLNVRVPPNELVRARNSPGTLGFLYSARSYSGFIAAQRTPVGAFAITQIVGKSGEKLAPTKQMFH
jgi:hypothetical protein